MRIFLLMVKYISIHDLGLRLYIQWCELIRLYSMLYVSLILYCILLQERCIKLHSLVMTSRHLHPLQKMSLHSPQHTNDSQQTSQKISYSITSKILYYMYEPETSCLVHEIHYLLLVHPKHSEEARRSYDLHI